jgi:peptidoglycan/LPS O-acetylase OafA/YrhL
LIANEKIRFEYLDVLRGCAALAVLTQHILGYVYHTYSAAHPLHLYIKFLIAESIDWGLFGVILFFLISGFIIPNSLKQGTSLGKFFISRVFRIYPAYWATLVLLVISVSYLGSPGGGYSYIQFLANLTMVPKIFGVSEMSGVFWTLFIEILFYGCCTLLFVLKWLEKPLVIGLIAFGLNLATPSAIVLNKFFQMGIPVQFLLFHLSFLFAGNMVRLAFVKKDRAAGYAVLAFFLLTMLTVPIASGLLFFVPEATEKGFVMFRPESVVYAYVLASAFFMFATYYKSLSNRFMARIGEISYSLYLTHMLCFVLIAKFFPPDTIFNFFTYLFAGALFSYVVAKFSFSFIERTAMELGRKIIKSYGYA